MSPDSIRGRRAAIQVQFTWMFALIAGAVILIFFVQFIGNLTETSEMAFCSDVTTSLTTIITAAQSSPGTMNNVTMPKLDMEFDCTGYNLPECREPFGNNIIFSPKKIEGHELITYALGWDMPYRSANILYLTQREARYIFFQDVSEIYDMMPDAVNKELVTSGKAATLKRQNSPLVRVVVKHGPSDISGLDLGALNSLDEDVLSVVGVNKASAASETAEVTFFKKRGDKTYEPIEPSFVVVGEEALLGAVYSGNPELFKCTLERALERYQYVTEVYLKRAAELKTATLQKTCTGRYGEAEELLISLYGDIVSYSSDLNSPGGIQTTVEDLATLNHRLKIFSCPTLY